MREGGRVNLKFFRTITFIKIEKGGNIMDKRIVKFLAIMLSAAMLMALGIAANAQESDAGTFDLLATGFDWGTPITGVRVSLSKPLGENIRAEDLLDAFSISIDLRYVFYGMDVNAESDAVSVKSAVISDDRTVLTLDIGTNYAEHNLTRISNFSNYDGSWKVVLAKDLGDLKEGTEFVWSGKVINEWADKFERLSVKTEYTYVDYRTGEATKYDSMNARLYIPDKSKYDNKGDGYPLVVWLHGGGEIGDDNEIHITANAVVNWAKDKTQDVFGGAYVLAPQNHAGRSVKACMDVIEYVLDKHPDIDKSRIYIGGCSYGGSATWSMIKAFPDYFAAAFPICSGTTFTEEDLENLYDLPIYMVVSTGDSMPVSMMQAYNALVDYALSKGAEPKTYIALFEHVDYDGLADAQKLIAESQGAVYTEENRFQFMALDHWSWIYVHNGFDAKGDDYDGKMFINTNAEAVYDNCSVVRVTENNIDEIRSTMGENIAKTVNIGDLLVHCVRETKDENGNVVSATHVYTPNFAPADIGFETFTHFLAAQTDGYAFPFKDVPAGSKYFDAVRKLYDAGLTNGKDYNHYDPDAGLTRAEFMTFLGRVVGAEVDHSKKSEFKDVPNDGWSTGYITWGAENGLIQGYGDGRFGPKDTLTQEHVNLIMERFADKFGIDFAGFDDPSGNATRGQVAVILAKLVD